MRSAVGLLSAKTESNANIFTLTTMNAPAFTAKPLNAITPILPQQTAEFLTYREEDNIENEDGPRWYARLQNELPVEIMDALKGHDYIKHTDGLTPLGLDWNSVDKNDHIVLPAGWYATNISGVQVVLQRFGWRTYGFPYGLQATQSLPKQEEWTAQASTPVEEDYDTDQS